MNHFSRQAINNSLLRGLVRSCFGNYVTIFTLHRAAPANEAFEGTGPEFLERCLTYAKQRGFYFASIDELVQKALNGTPLPGPTLCFTLDDGYADQSHYLIPPLLKYETKPTIFVIANLIDNLDWPWDAKLAHIVWNSTAELADFSFVNHRIPLDFSTLARRKDSRRRLTRFGKTLSASSLQQFMAAAQHQLGVVPPLVPPQLYQPLDWPSLRKFETQGLRIGSHGQSHYIFNSLTEDEIRAELSHTNRRLAAEIANPSKVFCYPSGTAQDFSRQHEPLVQAAGFIAAVTTISQCTTLRTIKEAPFRIQRIALPQTLDQFIRYSSWFEFLRSKVAN